MNETISKWFYGPIMHSKSTFDIDKLMYQDVNGPESWRWIDCADYENDESAWTQELYGRIEEAGLADRLTEKLAIAVHEHGKDIVWLCIRATPAQKAAALSRAIEEVA